MEFKILGPLEVLTDGRSVPITAPKQRALLAMLLLSPGQVVSSDRLLDELWAGHPPKGGAKTLQFHVSKLRDALQPDREPGEEGVVVTRAPGYAALVGPDDVDAARFERMVREARAALISDPARASRQLDEALSLWRGPALADFQYESFAADETRRLEERRLAALEDRIDAGLATGRHEEVVAELEKLIAEHPFRERLWSQLMIALYRCDRQADALRAYQRLRVQLGDELGIEPSAEVQALEERILLQHTALKKPGMIQPPGGRLRGFDLKQKLGEGAFGLVWRAAQPAVGRDVAVKIIKPQYSNQPDFVRRFEAEAKLVASLEHPHIVPIFDFWRDPDGAYLVMQLMERGGLDRATAEGWDPDRVVRVAEQIGSGLAYAHRRGLIHGDLHPGNVLLDADDNAYLADFGLAARLNGEAATPPEGYASPEQRRGEPPGPASDIFSLGALMFRLLTGTEPPTGVVQSVREVRPEISAAIDAVVMRATEAGPEARFGDVDEFVDELSAAGGERRTAPPTELRNPYKGLRAFAEADAQDFFGREAVIAELRAAIADHRLVGVVGPSGSGKSSLVRAGLLPALRAGRIPDSERWLVTDLYPGVDPFVQLADALLRVAVERTADLAGHLRDPATLVDTVLAAVPPDGQLLIVIDQFEELFTLCPDEDVQRGFMDALRLLSVDPQSRTRIVVTVRADFYGLPLEYQPFGDLLRGAIVSITPPSPEELAQAIGRPAAQVGVEAQPDLVAEVVREVSAQPGGLPLMEYALTQLFEERSDGQLTLDAYRRTGGVHGALGSWPERLFAALDEPAQAATRQICLRLTSVDDSGQDTRRRVPLPELHQLGIDAAVIDRVLTQFGSARLFTFDRDPKTRTPTVEVAHEALLQEWARLSQWIEGRREGLVLQRRFRTGHAEWETAGRDPGYLLQGGRLQQVETWAEETDLPLTNPEREFLALSHTLETDVVAKRHRRRRLVGASLAGLALVAVVFGAVALVQRDRATEQQQIAEQQATLAGEQAEMARAGEARALEQEQLALEEQLRVEEQERIARARELAATAVATLETDPELSVLLAIEAVEATRAVDGTVLREAEEALHGAVSSSRLVASVPAELYTRSLVFSPDGSSIYVGGFLSSQIAEVPAGRVEAEMPFPIAVVAVAGRNSELLVVGDFEGGLSVLSRESLEELFRLEGHATWITGLAVARDGTVVASISRLDGMTYVWDLNTREQIAAFVCEAPECPGKVALSRDGSLAVSGSQAWEVATGKPVAGWWTPPAGTAGPVQLLDDAGIAIVTDGITPQTVDLRTGDVLDALHAHTADVTDIDVSPDGLLVATAGRDSLVHIWEQTAAGARRVLTLAGHQGPAWKVEFSPDGKYLASLAGLQDFSVDFAEGWPKSWEARLWDISTAGSREWMSTTAQPFTVAFSPDGSQVVAGSDGATVWDVVTGAELLTFPGPPGDGQTRLAAFSPDGALVVTGGTTRAGDDGTEDEGWATVWDATTGAAIHELISPTPGVVPNEVAFSPDGSHLALAEDHMVRVWDTATWEVGFTDSDATTPGMYAAVGFSPDGRLLATQSAFPEEYGRLPVAVWSLETQELLSEVVHLPRDERGTVAFSPDGRVLLTAGLGRPLVSEVFTGGTLATLEAPGSYAAGAAFSSDGSRIATAEADGTIRLWDAATGEEQLVLTGHSAEVTAVAFSPGGARLASVSLDGTLRVWALDLDDLLDLARHRITRGFTDEECRSYIKEGCAPGAGFEPLLPHEWEVQDLLGITDETWVGAASGGTWQQLAPEAHPGPMTFDTQSGLLVVPGPSRYDEFTDTWEREETWLFDIATAQWTSASPAPGIPEGAVYHPGTDLVVVHQNDDGGTVAYNAGADTWTDLVAAEEGPSGRYGQGMVYDADSDRIVLFGGAEWGRIEEGKHTGLGDTWIYDPGANAWIGQDPATAPPPRVHHGMVYDAQSDRVVVFGGETAFEGDVYGDTWVYDVDTGGWTEMTPSGSPPARTDVVMWYDPGVDLVFLFGGSADASEPSLPWRLFGGEELWAYDYEANSWILFRVDPNPDYRDGADVAFDTQSGVAVFIGGSRYDPERRFQGFGNDVWTYRHDEGTG